MDRGAGSVDVSARPACPIPDHLWELFDDPVRDLEQLLGFGNGYARMVDGMYRMEPSSRGGMNSEPSFMNTGMVKITRPKATAITTVFLRSDHSTTGW